MLGFGVLSMGSRAYSCEVHVDESHWPELWQGWIRLRQGLGFKELHGVGVRVSFGFMMLGLRTCFGLSGFAFRVWGARHAANLEGQFQEVRDHRPAF